MGVVRRLVGGDELIYEEPHAAVAEAVAAALPELRGKAAELVGLTAPPVRVVVTSGPPAAWQYCRPTPALVGWFVGTTAALTLAAAFVGWVMGPGYPSVMLVPAAALMVVAVKYRSRGLMPLLVGLILAGAAMPLAFPVVAVLGTLGLLAATACWVRRTWRFVGGFAFVWGRLLRPAIVLHWPPPPRPAAVESLCFQPASTEDRIRSYLAHEYAHVLLHLQSASRPPAWLDEGTAFWLSEQLTGIMVWRPESRECIAEPEPAHDARRRFAGQESYYRLMARYYWEVRALAEAGRLLEVLAAPAAEVGRLRGEVTAGAGR